MPAKRVTITGAPLWPCWHCGAKPGAWSEGGNAVWLECPNDECGVRTDAHATLAEAIDEWQEIATMPLTFYPEDQMPVSPPIRAWDEDMEED